MFLRTEITPERKLVGKRQQMSFVKDTTGPLFASFMPHRHTISHRSNTDILCVQNYPEGFFRNFNPATSYEKWAGAEVNDLAIIPEGMESMIIPEGLYAVFLFRGTAAEAMPFFQNIYMNWFPGSEFEVDVRPHFDVLGAKYKHNSPDSEEEIWIPVKKKS